MPIMIFVNYFKAFFKVKIKLIIDFKKILKPIYYIIRKDDDALIGVKAKTKSCIY